MTTIEARIHDSFKHLTTLSTGSILILATFLDKFFAGPEWKILIGVTFTFLAISIFLSVISMFLWAFVPFLGKVPEQQEAATNTFALSACFSVLSFLLGITSFIFFALKNFY